MLSGIEIAEAVERHKLHLNKPEEVEHLGNFTEAITNGAFKADSHLPRIVIENFDPTPSHEGGRLNPNSYNLTLGNKLLVYERSCYVLTEIDDAIPAGGVFTAVSCGPLPLPASSQVPLDAREKNATVDVTIPETGLVLYPGVLYLGSTMEWTESYNCVPRIDGRSSIGRLGIGVHITAGFGDVQFKGRWTLEITAVHPVRIYPGLQICQISFENISPKHFGYQSKKYQNQAGVIASKIHEDTHEKSDKRNKE